ncbi:MAG: DUF503 domain-containing protein [Actinobacteria bacterium]|nr:DUF503 domain-containing protein [Actinomycetota bacterium]MBV9664229.1 DUF503 domain-containing protein [Actinomycetota bacterium]
MRHRPVRLPGPQAGRHHRDLRGTRDPTYVSAARYDLHLPHAHSLKGKRAVIKPIIEGARRRYQVAAAEVDFQDKWQRAAIGVAAVAATPGHAEEVLQAVERFVWSFPEAEVVAVDRSSVESLGA